VTEPASATAASGANGGHPTTTFASEICIGKAQSYQWYRFDANIWTSFSEGAPYPRRRQRLKTMQRRSGYTSAR
jgi:hypothetical protein